MTTKNLNKNKTNLKVISIATNLTQKNTFESKTELNFEQNFLKLYVSTHIN